MTASRLRAFLVDDESLALSRLARLLRNTHRVEIVGSETDPERALKKIRNCNANKRIDVLFIDIQMPGMSGFELLSRLPSQPLIVFTTAFDEYALRAFQENSIDYLLKPIDEKQLERALNKIERLTNSAASGDSRITVEQLAALVNNSRANFPEQIVSRVGERSKVIDVTSVSHFCAKDGLTFAVTDDARHIIDYTIAELEQKLDPRKFIRIHRSTILNVAFAGEIHQWFSGRMLVSLKDKRQTKLTVARDRVRILKERFGL